MAIKFHHYKKDFQAKAQQWWRSLSINEQKSFEQKHNAIKLSGVILRSEMARVFELENPQVST